MDRVNELRGAGGSGSGDSTLDTTSPPSEAYMSANDSTSKYFSLTDSTFDISPMKDMSMASTTVEPEQTITDADDIMSNLSPIGKKDIDSYKIGKQIEASNILSGGVDIFDDNDNSFDGDELVIDDNMEVEDKSNDKGEEGLDQATLVDAELGIQSKDTEVVLQIDGNNVNAIDIGNGLYLYRKHGQEELAAVQIIDDGQESPTFKFLKVRENSEGNLEVYEEIEIEIHKDMPTKEESGSLEKKSTNVPIKDISKVSTDASNTPVMELNKSPQKAPITSTSDVESELKESQDTKPEVNLNGKMMKFNESRKSPVVGTFMPMTYHSTPNKEGKPLTKTMVDLQLNPSRHSDNIKKTIEVHTDSNKQRPIESQIKKTTLENTKNQDNIEITETTEKYDCNIHITDKAIKPDDKQMVSKEKENNSITDETKKVGAEDLLAISLNKDIKQDDTLNELVIDEDLESNEIGKLVIDENQDELTDINQTDEKKGENLPKTCNVIPSTDSLPTPIAKCTESTSLELVCKEKNIVTEENSELEIEKSNKNDVSGAKEEQSVKADIITSTPQIADVSKIEHSDKSLGGIKKITSNIEKTEGISNKEVEVDSKKVKSEGQKTCNITELEEVPSRNNDMVQCQGTQEDSKPVVKYTKDTIEKVNTKKEVEEMTSSTTVINTEPSYINIEESKSNVSKSSEIQLKISDPIIKKEDIIKDTVAKVEINPSDISVVPKNELISATKQVTAVNETVVDKKHSSSELSKAVESDQNEVAVGQSSSEVKPINNNHNAVPFGKWTEVNRQEFLNKFKEHKAPVHTNSKQIKNSNDLNRRDVLKKIDSQRQSNIATSKDKSNIKNETIFSNKLPPSKPETKIPVKKDGIDVKPMFVEPVKSVAKQEIPQMPIVTSTVSSSTIPTKITKKEPIQEKDKNTAATSVAKSELMPRREVNVNDLINKTIEDMLNKVVPFPLKVAATEDKKPLDNKDKITSREESTVKELKLNKKETANERIEIFDDIEMKMNELHGIPFVERPPHELPKITDANVTNKMDTGNSQTINLKRNEIDSSILIPENAIDVDSEEEVIEHEPITGDIEQNVNSELQHTEVTLKTDKTVLPVRNDAAKKDTVITEKDFDKFARRNSITYDNCKTVSIETKESQNVVQNVKSKDILLSKIPIKEQLHLDVKSKLSAKQPLLHHTYSRKSNTSATENPNNKNYPSKIHLAYQTALTSKMDRRPVERPITIIEDKPVKVVFMDSSTDFVPVQLNVQGQELSPIKKQNPQYPKEVTTDSVDSGSSEQTVDSKQVDDHKTKTKHQRKQVLTPVETETELELIPPSTIGNDVSPKKKRKIEENKDEKHFKNLIHKKSYLLGRSAASDDKINCELSKITPKEGNKVEDVTIVNMNTNSALDNLVKAAELIENQSENRNKSITPTSDSSQSTPVKRGRGRPRKNPLPAGEDVKEPSPQKKPRLIDAKPVKEYSETDEDSSDGEIIKENWTMGKINENIVCPICNKLFRSENVVFKHVKHCTGVSPNRSESDKRSPRRDRRSQESDLKSLDSRSDMDFEIDEKATEIKKETPTTRKSKEINVSSDVDKTEVIVIEDTPLKKKSESNENQQKEKKLTKNKVPPKTNDLVCEFCGKTFRQLSYLVNHKLQHKKDEVKKLDKEKLIDASSKPQVFSCEVCKKEFRKLHHLVQHRLIHNTVPSRTLRKASSEQNDNKILPKNETVSKQNDDPSAAFRCEPCDKSFRKLHHLVEHRETHDGINRQKVSTVTTTSLEQPPAPPQCDVCKKTFRKLHHLIEHKEQHLETSSEKSDDKSVKSALSTKDIIHECSICYMVFPNEHSLNKHSGICQKKKRQSKTGKTEPGENVASDEHLEEEEQDIKINENEPKIIAEEVIDDDDDDSVKSSQEENKDKQNTVDTVSVLETNEVHKPTTQPNIEVKNKEITPRRESTEKDEIKKMALTEKTEAPREKESATLSEETVIMSDNIKKVEYKDLKSQIYKKRTQIKDKIAPSVTKRRRTVETTMPTVNEVKPAVESSDDDEVRYMLNPNFKFDDTNEGKMFMKVRANKRNSLQIERPNSKDLVKRRTSLQHPPKILRLKAKPVEPKIVPTNQPTLKIIPKIPKVEATTSTDSDDSDVKYSFPKTNPDKSVKTVEGARKKSGRKSVGDKRKTLSGIAKRKSLGQAVGANQTKPSPVKTVKKRTYSVEHRCDCGQLFSSAALLSRHTSLAHTPPRIRRRRSPPPEPLLPPPSDFDKQKPVRKSSTKSPAAPSARKSIRHDAPPTDTRKSIKSNKTEAKSVTPKVRRQVTAHKGVPVPEKMRKLMQKNKK